MMLFKSAKESWEGNCKRGYSILSVMMLTRALRTTSTVALEKFQDLLLEKLLWKNRSEIRCKVRSF